MNVKLPYGKPCKWPHKKYANGTCFNRLVTFQELINSLQVDTAEMPLFAQTDFVIKHSGLYDMYKQEKGEKGEVRIENLEEW